jgi:hypothetical protein
VRLGDRGSTRYPHHSRLFVSGVYQFHPDTGVSNDTTYCYSIFVNTAGVSYSAGRYNSGRPFVTSGPVKWAFSIGTAALAPPGNGVGVVHAVAMDNSVHSMTKGDTGGGWPGGWTPLMLSGPSQGRPTGVPSRWGRDPRPLPRLAGDATSTRWTPDRQPEW